jgi:FkbM family methyltransferase
VPVRDLIRPLLGVRKLSLLRQHAVFRGSTRFWPRIYARGGTSGAGSRWRGLLHLPVGAACGRATALRRRAGVLLRSVLEQATHRIVVRRRLPTPFGTTRIYVSSEGGLRFLGPSMGRVDPALLRLAAETVQPGDTVWDIGANLGLFSFAAALAAGPSGRVLAVEPDTVMADLLRRSACVNRGHAPVEVLAAAAADEQSVARFHVARRNRSTNHLDGFGTSQPVGVRSTQLVPAVTLDWLASGFGFPDVVKIDVEQAEAVVLTGASGVLGHAAAVICEVSACNSAVVRDLLTAHGYTLYDGDQRSGERVPVTDAPPNTLAIRAASRRHQRCAG